jgi:alpha-tubulin suppressor-like RCC1 family protein
VSTWTQVSISGAAAIVNIFPAAGYYSSVAAIGNLAALDANGNLYTCGGNRQGQIGNNTSGTTNVTTFYPVTTITNPVTDFWWGGGYVATAMALDSFGNVWTWGANAADQLFTTSSSTTRPAQVASGFNSHGILKHPWQ